MGPVGHDRLAWSTAVDAVTAEVTAALDRAHVPSVLLKGPTTARWLYDAGERTYTDSDLLVDPGRAGRARDVLGQLGFAPGFGAIPHPGMETPPALPWVRGPFSVDLHETLPGAGEPRSLVWSLLEAETVSFEVGGRSVRALSEPARLVHIALHAAHHGPGVGQPVADLESAVAQAPHSHWAEARHLSDALGAADAFANGLSLVDGGRGVLSQLGIVFAPSPRWLLRTQQPVPLAEGLEALSQAVGSRERARILVRELVPSPAFMRWWLPLARRSRRGLVFAYGWRVLYLVGHAPGGFLAWRRARRRSLHFRRSM